MQELGIRLSDAPCDKGRIDKCDHWLLAVASDLGAAGWRAVPWIHLDLGASNVEGGLAHIATDTTGVGVRYSPNLLLEQRVLERLDR